MRWVPVHSAVATDLYNVAVARPCSASTRTDDATRAGSRVCIIDDELTKGADSNRISSPAVDTLTADTPSTRRSINQWPRRDWPATGHSDGGAR